MRHRYEMRSDFEDNLVQMTNASQPFVAKTCELQLLVLFSIACFGTTQLVELFMQ